MQSINGKDTGDGINSICPLLCPRIASVASSFLAGKLSSVLITSIPVHEYLPSNRYIPFPNMESTSVSESLVSLACFLSQ